MLKKLLATSLACIMVLSSMAVVSFADTTEPTVIQEWVEDFDNYEASQFGVTKGDNILYRQTAACHDNLKHYHLANDWHMYAKGQDTSFINGTSLQDSGRGKINGDKALVLKYGWMAEPYIANSFNGDPVVLSDGKVLNTSYDWFNSATQVGGVHHSRVYPNLEATVTFTNGEVTYEDILIKITRNDTNNITAVNGQKFTHSTNEVWNKLDSYISKDKITLASHEHGTLISFDVEDYVPSDGTWSSDDYNSGFEISSVKSIRIRLELSSQYANTALCEHGFDNLSARVLDMMPTSIENDVFSNFTNFTSINSVASAIEGPNLGFYLVSGNGNTLLNYGLSENDDSGTPISLKIMIDDETVKDTTHPKKHLDSFLKIQNTAGTYIEGAPLCYLRVDGKSTPRAQLGDVVQYSYDFKLSANSAASSTNGFFRLGASLATGKGNVFYVSGNGVIFDSDKPSVSLAKLKENTWYSFDTVYELTEAGTVAKVYLDGKHILTKTLTGEYKAESQNYALRHTYVNEANADKTGYLENSVCLDNLCYQVFKGGVNAFNFDKSASTASNKAIANADVDFVNSTIFPVSNDWTVADFYTLDLANAVVTDTNGNELTAASDGDKALVGNKIKFSGDYGKDVSFTVSSVGGENVTKTSFVTLRENLGTTFVTSANAGKLLTAKAVKDGANLEVYIAEYNNGELVGLTIGEGVANYTPKTAGNTIKVFIWNDGELVPAFSGAASALSVN